MDTELVRYPRGREDTEEVKVWAGVGTDAPQVMGREKTIIKSKPMNVAAVGFLLL